MAAVVVPAASVAACYTQRRPADQTGGRDSTISTIFWRIFNPKIELCGPKLYEHFPAHLMMKTFNWMQEAGAKSLAPLGVTYTYIIAATPQNPVVISADWQERAGFIVIPTSTKPDIGCGSKIRYHQFANSTTTAIRTTTKAEEEVLAVVMAVARAVAELIVA